MQYITHLEAKDSYKNIKAGFAWKDIPQFAVITGENGSRKSSLLQGIEKRKFSTNHSTTINTNPKLFDKFELHGHDFNSDFTKSFALAEQELLTSHNIQRDFDHYLNGFSRAKQIIEKWTTIPDDKKSIF